MKLRGFAIRLLPIRFDQITNDLDCTAGLCIVSGECVDIAKDPVSILSPTLAGSWLPTKAAATPGLLGLSDGLLLMNASLLSLFNMFDKSTTGPLPCDFYPQDNAEPTPAVAAVHLQPSFVLQSDNIGACRRKRLKGWMGLTELLLTSIINPY